MKKASILIAVLVALLSFDSMAQTKFMQITTIESVIGGGIGRSRMLVTDENGTQTEKDMQNLFSMVGINMGNVKSNDADILTELKRYTGEGWKIASITPMTLSPGEKGGQGIFMTRYLLTKD